MNWRTSQYLKLFVFMHCRRRQDFFVRCSDFSNDQVLEETETHTLFFYLLGVDNLGVFFSFFLFLVSLIRV